IDDRASDVSQDTERYPYRDQGRLDLCGTAGCFRRRARPLTGGGITRAPVPMLRSSLPISSTRRIELQRTRRALPHRRALSLSTTFVRVMPGEILGDALNVPLFELVHVGSVALALHEG